MKPVGTRLAVLSILDPSIRLHLIAVPQTRPLPLSAVEHIVSPVPGWVPASVGRGPRLKRACSALLIWGNPALTPAVRPRHDATHTATAGPESPASASPAASLFTGGNFKRSFTLVSGSQGTTPPSSETAPSGCPSFRHRHRKRCPPFEVGIISRWRGITLPPPPVLPRPGRATIARLSPGGTKGDQAHHARSTGATIGAGNPRSSTRAQGAREIFRLLLWLTLPPFQLPVSGFQPAARPPFPAARSPSQPSPFPQGPRTHGVGRGPVGSRSCRREDQPGAVALGDEVRRVAVIFELVVSRQMTAGEAAASGFARSPTGVGGYSCLISPAPPAVLGPPGQSLRVIHGESIFRHHQTGPHVHIQELCFMLQTLTDRQARSACQRRSSRDLWICVMPRPADAA